MALKAAMVSVLVDDQERALAFYTEKLGFEKKSDIRNDGYWWVTVTAAGDPQGVELVLEPLGHPASIPYQQGLKADGIPLIQLTTDSVSAEIERLRGLGVTVVSEPQNYGVWSATIDDTCGNLIQIVGGE